MLPDYVDTGIIQVNVANHTGAKAALLPGISFVSRMLTPSERALLRQDLKETVEIARRVKAA